MPDALFALLPRTPIDSLAPLLADATLKATLLLAVAAGVVLAWRGASAAARHLVWSGALVGALALPLLSARLPAVHVSWFPDVQSAWAASVSEASTLLPTVRSADAASASASRDDGDGLACPTVSRWQRLLVALWAIGAALVLVPVGLGRLRVWRLARESRPVLGAPWADVAARVMADFPGAGRVRLLQSDGATMPMTWGVLHPVVLLPATAASWSEAQRRDVLLHELAHVRRRDCLTQLVAQLACALYWFHPLAWIAARRLHAEREHACDDAVLGAGSRPSDYASHLLDVAREMRIGTGAPFAAVAMARRAQLTERLLAVLDPERRRGTLSPRHALAAGAAAAAIALGVAAMAPLREAQAAPSIGDALLITDAAPPPPVPAAVMHRARSSRRPDAARRRAADSLDARRRATMDFIASTLVRPTDEPRSASAATPPAAAPAPARPDSTLISQ